MATLTGVGGSVTIAEIATAAALHFFEWSLDIQRDVIDDSNFSDASNARTFIDGLYHGVGRARATAAQSQALQLGKLDVEHAQPTADFELRSQTGAVAHTAYTFSGIITGLTVAVNKRDRVFYDVAFETSGDISKTTFSDT